MIKSHIIATATALPQRYYSQEVLATSLRKYCMAMRFNFELDDINLFFNNVKIGGRYFGIPIDSLYEKPSFSKTIQQAISLGVSLCEKTINQLLEKTGLEAKDISFLTVASMMVAAPSIDAQLMNRVAFSANTKRLPIVGLGCMAGAAAIARVADYLIGHPKEAAILIATEMSSVAWQGGIQADLSEISQRISQKDPTAYNDFISTVVSAALFGDGAGATLMVGREHPLAKQNPHLPKVVDSMSLLVPNSEGLMGLKYTDAGIRNILRNDVADFVKSGITNLLTPLLEANNLKLEQIEHWIVHPGGPKLIQAFEQTLPLKKGALDLSKEILNKIGNVSSSTVIFMLDEFLQKQSPNSGDYGILVAMGPGFSKEAVLLQW